MNNKYECRLCDYQTHDKSNYNKHIISDSHINKEESNIYCYICNKSYVTNKKYNRHKKYKHDNINNINNINNKNSGNNKDNNKYKEILKSNDNIKEEIKEEINKSKNEVVTVVNKALTKASSLINFLMENYKSTPPLKKIKKKECIDQLRLDYECPLKDNDYSLEKLLIYQYRKNTLISNLSKTILNLVHYKDREKQPIYNTDCSRYNYVVKTTNNLWYEDKCGLKFTDCIIKPFLVYINDLIEEYRENVLEKVNVYKNNLQQNERLLTALENSQNLEIALLNDYLIKPLLKELSPYLRFLKIELEELEKMEELEKIHEELEEYINTDNTYNSDDNKSYDIYNDSDFAEYDEIKKITKRIK